ncbi:uncharacterized protein LOC142571004 isoform X2 [Dermacentor variabilis]|uniref:uncharacterized protein LOC142571004 isoform X2 n=1 Tax=Dermacentor variabilis TaxID=34621 RepID=UPI003F5B860F
MATLCLAMVLWALTTAPSEGSVSACVNITLNDTLDIGSCVVTGLRQYGSPDGIVNALGPLLQLISYRLTVVGELGYSTLGNLTLGGTSAAANILNKVNTCNGSINILLPGVTNMSACSRDVPSTCSNAAPTTCTLKSLPQVQLMTTVTNVACDLQELLLSIQSSTAGPTVTTILTILSPIFNECGR